jgi:hypothetical protein
MIMTNTRAYTARVSDLMVDDLLGVPDPRTIAITALTPSGENVVVDGVVAFDEAAFQGYPTTVGQLFTITVPNTWIFASITRSTELPPPEPVSEEDIRAQYDEYGTGFPALELAE